MPKLFLKGNIARLAMVVTVTAIFFTSINITSFADDEIIAEDSAKGSISDNFTMIAQKDDLSFYADMSNGDFVLKDNKNHTWYSSPQDTSSDPYSKGAVKSFVRSLISVSYVNSKEVSSSAKENTADSNEISSSDAVEVKKIKNGVSVKFEFEDQMFTIPVKFTLSDGYLSATIDVKGIHEGGTYKILRISLLPGFGAGNWKQEGYIFVPDGCGALIKYNNDSTEKYNEMVYGDELVIEKELDNVVKQTIRIPVFGTYSDGQALMGVITEGDGAASVSASSGNSDNGYNLVNSNFEMRSLTPKVMLSKSYAKQYAYRMSALDENLEKYTVRYYPLTDEDANYMGFAKIYRQYQIDEKGLSKKESSPVLNVSVLGAIDVKANFLGLSYYKPTSITTFEQTVDMIENLQDSGIASLAVRYQGWQNDGLVNRKVPKSVKAMRILGGKKGLEKLISFAESSDISVYPDTDLINFNRGNANAAKSVYNEPAKQYQYMYSVYAPRLDTKTGKLLSLNLINNYAKSYLKSYKKLDYDKISLSTITNTIYSDLGKKNLFLRSSAPGLMTKLLKQYKDSGLSIAGDSANAYAIPYLDKIYNVPSSCSGFLIENEEVPFYQLVFHGYVEMTMPTQERSDDPVRNYLKAVETGSELMWTGISEDAAMLSDTTSDNYYSTTYTLWAQDAAEKYKEYMPLLEKISNSAIISHNDITKNVTKTVFDGGTTVIVNFSDSAYLYGQTEIPAKSFKVS